MQSIAALAPALLPAAPADYPLLVCEGNSISSPTVLFDPWPSQLFRAPWMRQRRYAVLNLAVANSDIGQIEARAEQCDVLVHRYTQPWMVVFELTNTLFHGLSVDQTYARHVAYCQARRAAGFRVLIGTGIDRNNQLRLGLPNTYTWEDMQRLNALIRDTWRTFADGLVDFAAIPELGPAGASSNSRYFYDGVHPSNAAGMLMMNCVLAELQRQTPVLYVPFVGT